MDHKMSRNHTEQTTNLMKKIIVDIEVETDCTYQDVICALDMLKEYYEKKGNDLLNSVSIKEVVKAGVLLG